ncbi:hypothetical protein ESA_01054 [Cronobacter sakazakii ATCC BAA-894]|uniref:Uncharacterized protein n=1 Tax=Cronobacter sakazakii (strain ATCC BAA-894) TaxID=290339 RepID=A7MLN2_CROS8|nr:hypothetical protein ESA_01054 [Cronobacter sakazakii ATCC BAA-894]
MQTDNVITHRRKHALHLMIAPFADGETHFGRGDHFKLRRFGEIFFIVELYAFGKQRRGVIRHRRFQRHQIGFLAMVARRGDAVRPLAVVSHQHQPGGVDIQPPCGVQLMRDRLVQKIEHRRVIRIVGGADVALRFVQHKIARAVLLDERIAVILDVVIRQQFKSAVFYNLAIHRDPAGANFTASNSAADAKLLGDKFIKSHYVYKPVVDAVPTRGRAKRPSICLKRNQSRQYNGQWPAHKMKMIRGIILA